MSKIDVDVGSLNETSTKLANISKELKLLRFDLQKLVGRIDDSWDGPASRAYIEKMMIYLRELSRIIEAIEQYRESVVDTANSFAELDKFFERIIEFMRQHNLPRM